MEQETCSSVCFRYGLTQIHTDGIRIQEIVILILENEGKKKREVGSEPTFCSIDLLCRDDE